MAVLIPAAVQVAGLMAIAIGFGLWLGWPAFWIAAGLGAVLYGIATEPMNRKAQEGTGDGTGTTD